VALVRTDVPEECIASETSFITRATRRHIPEDEILHLNHYLTVYSVMLSKSHAI
jgi:hypothetical protein